jgi:tetratricopeptide (TPR) repeat protein
LGRFEEGKAVLDKGLANALEVSDSRANAIAWVQFMHSWLSYFEGDGDNTVHHAQKGVKGWEEVQFEAGIGLAWSQLGAGYYLLEEYETARNHAEKGLELQKEVGMPIGLPICYWILALIHSALGDLKNAKDCAEEALKLCQEFKYRSVEGWAWMALGSIVGKADPAQINVAEKHIRQGISIHEELKAKAFSAQGYLSLGEVFADAGQRDKAIENLKKAEAMYLEMKVTPRSHWLTRTQQALERLTL